MLVLFSCLKRNSPLIILLSLKISWIFIGNFTVGGCRILANNVNNNIKKLKLNTEKYYLLGVAREIPARLGSKEWEIIWRVGSPSFLRGGWASSVLLNEGFLVCMATCSIRSCCDLVLV